MAPEKPKWLTWSNVGKAAGVAAFGVCVFASAGACAVAGVAAGVLAARASAGRWGGKRFFKAAAVNTAWALAGAGTGKGISAMYRHKIRYAKHMRLGRFARAWSRFRGYGGRGAVRGPGALHYMHQAQAGFIGSVYQNGWYKRGYHQD